MKKQDNPLRVFYATLGILYFFAGVVTVLSHSTEPYPGHLDPKLMWWLGLDSYLWLVMAGLSLLAMLANLDRRENIHYLSLLLGAIYILPTIFDALTHSYVAPQWPWTHVLAMMSLIFGVPGVIMADLEILIGFNQLDKQ